MELISGGGVIAALIESRDRKKGADIVQDSIVAEDLASGAANAASYSSQPGAGPPTTPARSIG